MAWCVHSITELENRVCVPLDIWMYLDALLYSFFSLLKFPQFIADQKKKKKKKDIYEDIYEDLESEISG